MAIQTLLGISGKRIESKLGPRDATLLRAGNESGLWRCQRVRCYQLYRDVMPPENGAPLLYSLPEASFLVGVCRETFKRIAPRAPAYAIPEGCTDRRYPLFTEPMLRYLRAQIASGDIKVQTLSLSRPRAGVTICPPRHVHAENLGQESESCRKWQSWTVLA
jgi:hypothetical protein